MYKIDGFLKLYDEDVYNEGCRVGGGGALHVDMKFEAETIEEVIKNTADWLDVDEDGIERDSGDTIGRVDFSVTENEASSRLTDRELEQWKRGEIKAFSVTYIGYVEEVTRVSALPKRRKTL